LRYKYSDDVADLEKALPYLESSVKHYRDLANLTKDTYLYANSMQTAQRKIPIRGVDATFITWVEVLPVFEKELDHFQKSIDSLKANPAKTVKKVIPLKNADVKVLSEVEGFYQVNTNQGPFSDTTVLIQDLARELQGLKGIKMSKAKQLKEGTRLTFSNSKPVKVLVGCFNKQDTAYAKAPELETDASANDYGQADIKISNAVLAGDLPPVNIHTYSFPAGKNTLNVPKGACLVLGFIEGKQEVNTYDAGLAGNNKDIDWLFE
jgi:hypothetical protein